MQTINLTCQRSELHCRTRYCTRKRKNQKQKLEKKMVRHSAHRTYDDDDSDDKKIEFWIWNNDMAGNGNRIFRCKISQSRANNNKKTGRGWNWRLARARSFHRVCHALGVRQSHSYNYNSTDWFCVDHNPMQIITNLASVFFFFPNSSIIC